MLLFACAVLILGWGFLSRKIPVGERARRRLLLIGALTIIVVAGLSMMRLAPLAGLALLVGAGFAANVVITDRARRGDFSSEEQGPARADGEQAPRAQMPGAMAREEALAVLGLEGTPDDDDVKKAYKKMIVRAHPDQGGSDYLAAKVNEARKVLLGDEGQL